MDFDSMFLFGAMKRRFGWLAQRQEVLAENIANADTPGEKAHDLKPFSFRRLLGRETMTVNMDMTRANHLTGDRKRLRDFAETETRRPYETAPAGNTVILEEQMMKLSETELNHRMTTDLYKKHVGMFRMALGRGGR